jgi:hypothetical protein
VQILTGGYSPQAKARLSEILRPTVTVWMRENSKTIIFLVHGFSPWIFLFMALICSALK